MNIVNGTLKTITLALLIGAGGTAVHAAELKKVAIITPEQAVDYGWNQNGVESLKDAAKATGKEIIVAQGAGYGNIRPILRDLADEGAGLIIAHAGGYGTEGIEIAKEIKGLHVATQMPGEAPYIAQYNLMGDAGSYLAGVLAAKMTKTGKIGIVVAAEIPSFNAASAGFAQGVKATNPNIVLRYAVIGPAAYSDAAGARRVAETVIASGADIIFGQGNGATFGMLQAVETTKTPDGNKVWFIDVIGDKTPVDKGYLLSSVVWNFRPMFTQMIKDVESDTFGKTVYELSLADDSEKLLKSKYIPEDVWADIEKTRQGIISGQIKVQRVLEAAATRAMMTETIEAQAK